MGNQKSNVLNEIKEGWLALQSILSSVPEDKMEEPDAADGWSVKDIIGHIATWEEIIIDRVQTIVGGHEVVRPYSDLDDFNAQEVDRKSKLSLDVIQQQSLDSHQRLLRFLEDLPEEHFAKDSESARVITVESYKHYAGHAENIKR